MALLRKILSSRCGSVKSYRPPLAEIQLSLVKRDFASSDPYLGKADAYKSHNSLDSELLTGPKVFKLVTPISNQRNIPTYKSSKEDSKDLDFVDHVIKVHSFLEVLALINVNPLYLTKPHAVFKSLHSLFLRKRMYKSFINKAKIFVATKEFELLCNSLVKNLTIVPCNDLVGILHFLEVCEIPPSSLLMQKVNTLILDNINKYSYIDILRICSSINSRNFKGDKLATALQSACVTSISVKRNALRINSQNWSQLISLASRRTLPFKVRETIFKSCLSFLDSNRNLKFSDVLNLLKCAVDMTRSVDESSMKYLFEAFMKFLTNSNSKTLTINQLNVIRQLYLNSVALGHLNYNEMFCDKMADYFVENQVNLNVGIGVMKNLCEIEHLNASLLRYLLKKLDWNELARFDTTVLGLAIVLSNVCLTKIVTEEFPQIEKHFEGISFSAPKVTFLDPQKSREDNFAFLRWNVIRLTLGLTPQDLPMVFNQIVKEYTSNRLQYYRDSSLMDILLLYQYTVINHPSVVETFPKLVLDQCLSILSGRLLSFKAQGFIQSMFGGPDYVLKKCTTNSGHILSYVVLLTQDNKPINVSAYVKLNELSSFFNIDTISSGNKVLAIQEFSDCFPGTFRNVDVLTGKTKLLIKLFEDLGHNMIYLDSKKFQALLDFEKKEVLLSMIKSKIGNIDLKAQEKN